MLTHTRSISETIFEVWRSPGRFTKNPDLILLPSGRLMLVYCDTDQHWSIKDQYLILLVSDDRGKSWSKFKEVDKADLSKGDARLVTPRLSRLDDGRLVILIDNDDFGNFHEDQPSGIWAYWSEDEGETWSKPQNTGILGYEPDRMLTLPDGRLGVATQYMLGESQEYGMFLYCSDDAGASWYKQGVIAHDGYNCHSEGALVFLDGGKELACVMRQDQSAGNPSYVVFSKDGGKQWSTPQMCPFSFHRPYAKRLPDGRVLVTGRNANGGLGTYAWCGDLKRELGHHIGGPRRKFAAELTNDALVIENLPDHECKYSLLPPQSSRSEVLMEANVKVDGPKGGALAFMSVSKLVCIPAHGSLPVPRIGEGAAVVLFIGSDWVGLNFNDANQGKQVDMTRYRKLTIHHKRGLLQIRVDGETIVNNCVFGEDIRITDSHAHDLTKRTMFGGFGENGRSSWKNVTYDVKNPTLNDHSWKFDAADGRWPNQYQRDRLIQIHGNHPDQQPWPDHGYSSWVVLDDGKIMFVDYTNCGDVPKTSHLVGTFIDPEKL